MPVLVISLGLWCRSQPSCGGIFLVLFHCLPAMVAFFWCYSTACSIPTLCFQGNSTLAPTEQSEELLPAHGSPVSCPFTRALLVQSKAASPFPSKAECPELPISIQGW